MAQIVQAPRIVKRHTLATERAAASVAIGGERTPARASLQGERTAVGFQMWQPVAQGLQTFSGTILETFAQEALMTF